MGFLRRLVRRLRGHQPAAASTASGAGETAARPTAEGTITGISIRPAADDDCTGDNSGTTCTLRISWHGPQLRHVGIALNPGSAGAGSLDGLRLGEIVPLRVVPADGGGDTALLDWAMLGKAWGGAHREPTQAGTQAPQARLRDRTIETDRAQTWTSHRGRIDSVQTAAGSSAADRWDIVVQYRDGSSRTSGATVVPFYAQWYAHPGAEVPTIIDPVDDSAVQIDWPALGAEHEATAGRWSDEPPVHSVAAIRRASR